MMNSLNLSVPLADSKIMLTWVVPQISAAVSTSQLNSWVDTMTCAHHLTMLLICLLHMILFYTVGTMKQAPTNAVRRSASWCATNGMTKLISANHTNANLACPALRIEKSVSPTKSPSLPLRTRTHILPLSIPERSAKEEAPGCRQLILSLAPGLNTMTIQMDFSRTVMSCLLR